MNIFNFFTQSGVGAEIQTFFTWSRYFFEAIPGVIKFILFFSIIGLFVIRFYNWLMR